MSHPYSRIDLSSSSLVACPSVGQSSLSSLSSAPESVFGQKLIPRDFLGLRATALPDHSGAPSTNTSKPTFSPANPFQSDREKRAKGTQSGGDKSASKVVRSNENTITENNVWQGHALKSPKTRSPQSTESLPSIVKGRSASYGSPSTFDFEPANGIIMPRTSSIDSAISNVSTSSLTKAAADIRDPSPASVRNLIATAGGAENLVIHLLKDRNNVASQNAQLWKLMEKQRALLLGLNRDLERVAKERDRYKKQVKELHITEDGAIPRALPLPDTSQTPLADLAAAHRGLPISHPPHQSGLPRIYAPTNSTDFEVQPSERKHKEAQDKENVTVPGATKPTIPGVHIQIPSAPIAWLPQPSVDRPNTAAPTFNVIEASPLAEKPSKGFPSNRKAPPKPLNLVQGKGNGHSNHQVDAKSESSEITGDTGRGRRRTREEDDKDREKSAMKAEAETRSRSKKNKVPNLFANEENQAPAQTQVVAPLPTPGLPLSPRPQHAQTFVAPSIHLNAPGVLQPASIGERLLAAPLKSPGLPSSPRPQIRNDSASIALSLPLSPRANMGAFPLSPRAPKHALPAPTAPGAPADAAALQNKQSRSHQPSPQQSGSSSSIDRLQVHQPVGSEPPPVYRGLAISAYPNLLLPPNALPSIQVKVHSSRLRPSRHTVLSVKSPEDTTVFSLSIISRSSNSELWRIEKVPGALPQLEQQLRPRCSDLPRIPDRKVFSGQSPASLDDRRTAVDSYFDELLDIHVDEQAAVTICRFLSTDVVDPEHQAPTISSSSLESGMPAANHGAPQTKTGYLTKRGKNFGGWKSRFFILEGPNFRYYEAAGGPHLGTIRLQNALIGKQKETDVTEDVDGQFRHAFLIQEPKRKDSVNFTRHVLCAESDAERDEWVNTLLHWVEGDGTSRNGSRSDPSANTSQEFNIDTQNQYTKAGPSSKDARDTHINTPTPTSGSSIDSSIMDHIGSLKQANISAPMNGNIITDTAVWGHKPQQMALTRDTRDKTHKMSNIFGFKKPEPGSAQPEQKPAKPRILRHNGYVRPVFGLPLTEAVEYCTPFNVDVNLPAVVYRSIEYLRFRNAANEEGLFRLSGSNVVVRNLKERFNTEGDVDLVHEEEYHDVHAVASLFKTYLRELPSTLLTRDLHIEFIKGLEIENRSDKVSTFNALVHMLPPANFSLLKEMSKFLLEVTGNADKNKMSVRNIGIVFSPTLNIPTPAFTLFLTEYSGIFETQVSQSPTIRSTQIQAPLELTPDEIRSPRHQMFSDLPTPAPSQTTFPSHPAVLPFRGTMTGTGELGFMPINPIQETGTYSPPQRTTPLPSPKPLSQIHEGAGFGSLNGLLVPTNAPTEKARKRHSQIYMSPPDLKLG